MKNYNKPLPEIRKESAPFWEGTRQGKLLVQKCNSCDARLFYPRRVCPECWSEDLGWIESNGKGTIYSCTTTYLGTAPEFKEHLPINIAWIDLDEGVRMASNIIGCGPDVAKIGDRVEVVYEKATDNITMPFFKLIDS